MSKGGSNTSQASGQKRSRRPSNSRFTGVDFEESPFPPPSKLRAKNLAELFFETALDRDLSPFAQFRDHNDGGWITVSYREAALMSLALASYLAQRGVKHGDRVAIISGTRYEWIVADMAILSLGAVSVSVYQTLTAHETGYILWDCGALHVIVENEEQLDKLKQLEAEPVTIPERENFAGGVAQFDFHSVISFEDCEKGTFGARLSSLQDVVHRSTPGQLEGAYKNISNRLAEINRDQLATIVYTSGTTGPPKGVIQTHGNHLAMIDMVLLSGLMGAGRGVFLYLPLAHSFARLIPFIIISVGGDLFFPSIIDPKKSRFEAKHLLSDIAAASPSIVPSVPRIFEKIMSVLDVSEPKTLRERLVKWSINLRKKHYESIQRATVRLSALDQLKLMLAELITAKVRHRIFGKRLRYAVSGGAPISVEVLEFFRAIGVLILEGYGLTETTPALNVNTVSHCKFGTVGRAFEGVELRIAEDGEILAKGANVAKGYWRCPQATEQAWSKDGWFATGDIGEIDDEGYLKITDRKKDLIVTAGGKKVPPAMLEGRLKNSPYISHALVFGEKKPYLVALITLDEANAKEWARAQQIALSHDGLAELVKNDQVRDLINKEISQLNAELAGFEQIKRFDILDHDFTIENGMLSPSLKVKRKVATERYRLQLDALYD